MGSSSVLRTALWLALALAACSKESTGDKDNPIGAAASGGASGGVGGTGAVAGDAGAAGMMQPVGGMGGASGPMSGGSGGTSSSATGGSGGVSGAPAGSGGTTSATGGSGGTSGMSGMTGGSGGMSGMTGGGGGMGGEGGAPPAMRRPPCLAKPSQVIFIGDSYINYTEVLGPDVAARAIADGALQDGEEYRMYAVPGSSMASGGIAGFIPDQFTLAVNDDADIIATIMTGGGNDLLIPDALLGGAGCIDNPNADMEAGCTEVVALALDKAKELMSTAAQAGVSDVIYFFYPNLPGGGFGGSSPNVMLDYAYPRAEELCDSAIETTGGKLTCHFIDLRPIFAGHDDWIQGDGVHPTAEGHEAMATEIYGVMKDNCIAQPESSGCCEP